MKKIIKRNKNIFIGLMSLALISLASIGFSTWVIEIDEHEDMFNVNISIETIYNGTVIATTEAKKKTITLDNLTTSTGDETSGVVGGEDSKADTSVPLSIDLIVADDQQSNLNDITFGVVVNGDDETSSGGTSSSSVDKNIVKVTTNEGSSDLFGRVTNEYSYLTVSLTSYSLENTSFTNYEVDGFKQATITLDNFSITYGNYFENKNPEEFYNDKLNTYKEAYLTNKTTENLNNYLSAIQQAETELKTMKGVLDGQTLTIQVSVNTKNSGVTTN